MSDKPGATKRHFQVAIVGAGPSGFYAADALLRSDVPVHVDVFERLAAPFGLVRYGVAPDHPRLKATIKVFERIAEHKHFHFRGNVEIGKDLTLDDLRANYDAVVLAHGSRRGREISIPGGSLPGCHTATDFVGWYNGHPDFAHLQFDLGAESVAIVGNGNVALDLARILLQPIDLLRETDIAEHALDALAESRVREVHIIGRRGPAQAAFTNMELRELGELPGVAPVVYPEQLELNPATQTEIADKKGFLTSKNLEYLKSFSERRDEGGKRRAIFHFLRSPLRAIGTEAITRLVLGVNRLEGEAFSQRAVTTELTEEIPCGLLLSSIGYQGEPLAPLPFDVTSGTYINERGQVSGESGLFTAGWIKRGPTGIIGTNKACSNETVSHLLSYLEASPKPEAARGFKGLQDRVVGKVLGFEDWLRLDRAEVAAGAARGKPREKILDFSSAIASL